MTFLRTKKNMNPQKKVKKRFPAILTRIKNRPNPCQKMKEKKRFLTMLLRFKKNLLL